jgi:hypothetical protein
MSVMMNEVADRREVRWSANRKTDVVLRLLRGARLEDVSRDIRGGGAPGGGVAG